MNAIQGSPHHFDRRLYLGAGIAICALVFWGFARSYYLKTLLHSPALPVRLHIHGAVMTLWLVLLFTQTCLIAAHRVDLHRRLGVFATMVAAFVVIVGSAATLHAAAREVHEHTRLASIQVTILGLELVQMFLFAGLVGGAIALRRRTDVHKRLILLGTSCMLPSAFARIPFNFTSNFSILMMFNLFVLTYIAIDTFRNRRMHPAFGWGGSLVLGSVNLAYLGSYTPAWIRFGTWLVS